MNQDKDISILKDLGLKWDLDTIFNKDTLPQIGLYAIEQSEESSSHYCVGDTHQQGSQPEIKTTVALLQILLSMLLTKKAKKQTKNNPPPKKNLFYNGKWSKHNKCIYFTKNKRKGQPFQNIIEYLWISR